jgi:acetyl-CoA carboxylase carboxyl transferase subunit beta
VLSGLIREEMMSWFRKPKYATLKVPSEKIDIPQGLWSRCEECKKLIYKKELERNLKVCPSCGYHFRLGAQERINFLLDKGSFQEYDGSLSSKDPLNFQDSKKYKERLKEAEKKTGLKEATLTGEGNIEGHQVVTGALDFGFIGGSMASVVGEKLSRAIERAGEKNLPLIIASSSGGARMQEGILSLMQMAKTSGALARLNENKSLYISILTNPTTGGVAASFAFLGDIIISEPRALIGFAGPRVIEQTIREKLPPGFQRAEFLLEHGLIDMVVERKNLKETLVKVLDFFGTS